MTTEHHNVNWQSVFIVRCVERMLLILAATTMMVLGVWLFARGVPSTDVSVSFLGFVLQGQGPGLALMGTSSWLLYQSLKTPLDVTIRSEGNSSRVVVLGSPDAGPTRGNDVPRDKSE